MQALELPKVFSDRMVLQQGQPLPVWGRAEAGATVTVKFGQQSVNAVAEAGGNWMATLAPETASATPATLTVRSGDKELSFDDVLVGEVWLCSGQSNMEWSVNGALNGDIIPLSGGNPQLRFYHVERHVSVAPRFSANATWTAAQSDTIPSFSAVAYHFGSTLQPAVGVPVGLIAASWGGTPAISWTRPSAFDKHPLLAEQAAEWEAGIKTYPERKTQFEAKMADWKKAKGLPPDARVTNDRYPDAPWPPAHDPESSKRPGVLANGMLASVAPFAIRGAIWYQGEADAGWEPDRYDERLAVMVNDWRVWWNNPQLAFGVVQLAGFKAPSETPTDDPWSRLRESQRRFVRKDSHAGLAVAIDIGEANDIHPFDKQTVGQRLARWALADVYQKIKLRGGPEPVDVTFDDFVRIRFESVGGGLWILNGGDLQGFTLAGADGVFHVARAEIKGKDTVEVRSPSVPVPQTVRYAWAANPRGANLSNKQRLPAGPFELKQTNATPIPARE
ncbi:MAG: sialate O-acetylesterase [Candidatus Methylacidiphilales bacterium]|nr:sialate O-acetylesterase [Candidatus Methylacidiphilales bacterium]